MHKPLVSIIVSCFNGAKYIAETLNSLVNQTYSNLEIIVVNDGSIDTSEQIIKSNPDTRIRYYYQNNKGQCAALNYGFSLCTGSLIKFYDADDLLHPLAIQGQVESLKGSNDLDISFIEWRRFFDDKGPSDADKMTYNTIHRNCSPVEYLTYKETMPMVQCGIWLLPKALLLKAGLWNEKLSLINDTEFFTRVLYFATGLKFSEKGTTFYRTNFYTNSLSSDFSKKGIKSALLSIDYASDSLLKIEKSERIRKVIFCSYVMILEWAYPKHLIYSKLIEKRLRNFPEFEIVHTRSGRSYNIIMALFGWKVASRLSRLYYKIRYKKS